MMMKKVVAALAAFASIGATQAQDAEAVRAGFIRAVDDCRMALAAAPKRAVAKNQTGWVASVTESAEVIEMDAKSGASILTPWTGVVKVRTVKWNVGKLETEQAAMTADPMGVGMKFESTTTIRVAWSKEAGWRVHGAEADTTMTMAGRPDRMRYPISVERLLSPIEGPLSACAIALNAASK